MKKITWKTKPLYQDLSMKQYIASCEGKDMCHITEKYRGGVAGGGEMVSGTRPSHRK